MTARDTHRTGRHLSDWLPFSALWIGGGCVLIELVLQASDLGLIGSPVWRSLTYQNGAFWPGLLRGWRANYTAQPALMFVTYAFLHGGFWHLAGNMLALLVLTRIALQHVGQGRLCLIYAISALGGAATFGVLAPGPQPMVGASGALFGVAAACLYWQHRRPLRGLAALIAFNIVLWLFQDGTLAWQTHLGGIFAGWGSAWLLRRRDMV